MPLCLWHMAYGKLPLAIRHYAKGIWRKRRIATMPPLPLCHYAFGIWHMANCLWQIKVLYTTTTFSFFPSFSDSPPYGLGLPASVAGQEVAHLYQHPVHPRLFRLLQAPPSQCSFDVRIRNAACRLA